MQLTKEQEDIINSTGNIKINAVAGSGKTTTVIEYARTRPSDSRILYLAFNKSVKLEASKKFTEKGLHNVTVETAHSLAFKYIVPRYNYKIRTQDYKTLDIVEALSLKVPGEKHDVFVVANHVLKFAAYFCNSDKEKVSELDYLDLLTDEDAKAFVLKHYEYIEMQTRNLLAKMYKGEMEITHDFYLKRFQLSAPRLPFDYILFDEGQDASPAMLDVFFKQTAVKVIVGDTHQQIYGWRFAVNSLEKADFQTFQLSNSFRFPQEIADLAIAILQRKELLAPYKAIPISGKGNSKEVKVKAILARTNLGLLVKAIEYVTHKKDLGNLYFEGNINSYMYADEGASLYDVLNLYNMNNKMIKDKLMRGMNDIEELEDYIEKTEDAQLGMMLEIVKEYGNKIPGILRSIKEKHVENSDRDKAEVIFSTIHRCKGLEYDSIELVDDFLTEEKLEKIIAMSEEKGDLNIDRLNEEINLLYVAVTRAKNLIVIPETLMPENFPSSYRIRVVPVEKKTEEKTEKGQSKSGKTEGQKSKSGSFSKKESLQKREPVAKREMVKKEPLQKREAITKREFVKKEPIAKEPIKHAGAPWTDELDAELSSLFAEGKSIVDLSRHFSRSVGAIRSRINKLELE